MSYRCSTQFSTFAGNTANHRGHAPAQNQPGRVNAKSAPNRAPLTYKVNFIVLRPVEAAAGYHAAVFPKKTGPWVAPRIQRPAGSRTRQIRGAGQIRAICSMRPSQCRFTDRHYQSPRKIISGLCSSSQSAGADLRSQKGLWAAQLRRACNSAPGSGCRQDQD
jgi:hypothetical protein